MQFRLFFILAFLAPTFAFAQLFGGGGAEEDDTDDDFGVAQNDDFGAGGGDFSAPDFPEEWPKQKFNEPQFGKDWESLSRPVLIRRFTAAEGTKYDDGVNPHSVYPINKSDLMTRMTIWRFINLKEKTNLGFYAKNQSLFEIIFEGVLEGSLRTFVNDSLITPTPDLKEALKYMYNAQELFWLSLNDIFLLELREDVVFDKKRSRVYYDIQSLSFFVPPDKSPTGVLLPLFTVRYKDLVEFFDSNPRAFWYNSQNNAEHRRFSDAFDLRLFSSRIRKVSNAKDDMLSDVFSDAPGKELFEAYKMDQWLVDKESVLWSY